MKQIIKLKILMAIFLIVFLANPSSASINAAGGYAPDFIQENTTARFSGTIYNLGTGEIFVRSFNVSFVKTTIGGASGSSRPLNVSKAYPDGGIALAPNSTFADVFDTEISFEPAQYNVSISFGSSNATNQDLAQWNDFVFAMRNKTVTITGTTDPTSFFIGFGITLGVVFVGYLGLIVYNAKFK